MLAEREDWLVENLTDAATVVELGCGDGNLALALESGGARPDRYVGVDLLDDRIAAAIERVPWGEFHVASAAGLPVGDETVDAVAAATMLSSMPLAMRPGVYREVDRVLRPGGRFVVYDLRVANPLNPATHPVSLAELRAGFEGWALGARRLTLLPPLARSRLTAPSAIYRVLDAIPWLHSHIGAVLLKPLSR